VARRMAENAHRNLSLSYVMATWGLLVLLVFLIILFSILAPQSFPTAFTFTSLMNSRSVNALLALGIMVPLAANQYDLSGASVLGLAQILAIGLQVYEGLPWPLTVALVLLMGMLTGLLNGFLVVRLGVNSFIATLGTGTFLYGLNQWYSGGTQIIGQLPRGFAALSDVIPGIGIPAAFLYVLVLGGVLWVTFEYLLIGRHLYVLGDNPKAAELIGISPGKSITGAFVVSGFMAALAGVVLQAQLRTGVSTIGGEFLLPAFTAVLLGATSVRPGRANVLGTLLATAVLGVVVAGLGLLGVPFFVEPLFNGGMLVVAVALAVAVQRRRDRRSAAVPTLKSAGQAAARS
jgi:ribose transport system permease protein